MLQKLTSTAAIALLVTACNNSEPTLNSYDHVGYTDIGLYSLAEGVDYDRLGMHEEAQAIYRQALADDVSNLNLLSNIAMSKLLVGESAAAETILQQVVSSPDASIQHRTNLALVYGVRDKMNAARLLLSKDLGDHEVDQNLALYSKIQEQPELLADIVFPPLSEKEQLAFNERALALQNNASMDSMMEDDAEYYMMEDMPTDMPDMELTEPSLELPPLELDAGTIESSTFEPAMLEELPPLENAAETKAEAVASAIQEDTSDIFIIPESDTTPLTADAAVPSPSSSAQLIPPPVPLPAVPAEIMQMEQDSGM